MLLRASFFVWLSMACASPAPPSLDGGGVVRIDVLEDGTLDPPSVTIRSGDTIEWVFHDPHASIVETDDPGSAACPAPSAWSADGFTGPMPLDASGIFVLSSLGSGLRARTGTSCGGAPVQATANGQVLCPDGTDSVMSETWQDPAISGAFIRMLWSDVAISPGADDSSFDFRAMDALIDAAVRSGRVYSLGFKAGNDGTPDWIFSTDADGTTRPGGGGGVARLALQDGGSDAPGCGPRMFLGSPTDPMFEAHYFDLLRAAARHLRERADRYRALAYIKPGGANLFSHENRLPKRCDPGCVCNTQVFAEAGYTPTGLYEFYSRQLALLAEELPGKPMAYALIQDGFPSVNDAGDYELADGTSSGGALPAGTEQTETILHRGQDEQGIAFVVQHNGLGPAQAACPNAGMHPAAPPYGTSGGCPNRWVLRAGYQGAVTGFQTNNDGGVANAAQLEQTFQNALDNSDAVFVEIYEDRAWEARELGVLDASASGRTLAEWAELFHARRRESWPALGDPYPQTYRHTFVATAAQTLYYIEGRGCDPAAPHVGTIVIRP